MKNFFKILFIPIGAFISVLFVGFILNLFQKPIEPSSNNDIIKQYSIFLRTDSLFLNQVASAFLETKYTGSLHYNLQNAGGYHTLWSREGENAIELADSFPKIRQIIKDRFPDARDSWYGYKYNNGVVFISTAYPLYNNKKLKALLIYCPNLNDLKPWFSEYNIYQNNTIPTEPFNWLYQIDKNWYICSPGEWLAPKI